MHVRRCSVQAESGSERATVRAMLPSSLTVGICHTNSWVLACKRPDLSCKWFSNKQQEDGADDCR